MSIASTSSPTDMQTIRLRNWGEDLSGRTLGEEVRGVVSTQATEVVFDCSGIESMSPSFADELFGKLSVESSRPKTLRVAHAEPDIISVIRFAVQERSAPESGRATP